MSSQSGYIFDIKRFAIHDGPGIRTTVFLKGCPMKCRWCHNPESQAFQPQQTAGGQILGSKKTVAQVMAEIEKEIIFYDTSNGGVTFSGGEPMAQPDFLMALLKECKKKEIHTAVDTTGDVSPDIFNALAQYVDLFLYDLKLMDEQQHIAYTGVSNRFVHLNLKYLANQNLANQDKDIVVRFPVIPGITDSVANIEAAATFISSLKTIREINLLPYHRTAEAKYKRLNIPYRMVDVNPPGEKQMDFVKEIFEKCTKNIHIKKKYS
jgi:pyruvate formate lyase activating enzyme